MAQTPIKWIDINRHEREAMKIRTKKNTYQAKSCPVCGKVLDNPAWKVCKSCYEYLKDQKKLEHKKENKH